MPLYTWHCKECDHRLDILRTYDECRDQPKETDPEYQECTAEEHDWEKELGTFSVSRSPGYGSKGNWLILLGIGGLEWLTRFQDMLI